MRSNVRLQRVLATRQLGRGGNTAATAAPVEQTSTLGDDLRLFALTFAGGFFFISLFIA